MESEFLTPDEEWSGSCSSCFSPGERAP